MFYSELTIPQISSPCIVPHFLYPKSAVTVVSLPIVIYALHFICNADHCLNFTGSASQSLQRTWASMRSYSYWPSHEGLSIFLGWMLLQLLMQLLLPGETVQGCPVQDTRPAARPQGQASLRTFTLPYTLSGHLQFCLSLALVLCSVPSFVRTSAAGASPTWGLSALSPLPLHLLYDHYLSLAGTACIFSALLSIYLYASSFSAGADGKGQVLAKGGNTGSAVYDFFIGRELNPRIGPLDLKCFCELRPGLIGWLVINLGMAAKQFQRAAAASPSHTGSVSLSMLLLVASQGFYVWDALYNERAILSTMDITTDGFGYMLAFGDLAWVPFIYSLQARYLVDRDPALSSAALVAILALQLCGYAIFRLANGQKDAFRRDPEGDDVKHLRYLQTKRGTRLIVSGWWGAARTYKCYAL